MTEETKFTITTTDKHEAILMLNATKLALALSEFQGLHRQIYNGKNYDAKVLFKDKIYDRYDFELKRDSLIQPEDRNEQGFLKEGLLTYVYTEDDVEKLLWNNLEEINQLLNDYFE